MPTTIYVDTVQFRDAAQDAEIRGYLSVEHLPGWVIWRWSDETVAIPSDRIADIVTTEELTQ